MISLGATRTMQITDKERVLQATYTMEAGDIFILGPQTNANCLHGIAPEQQDGSRISLVMRDIKTTMSLGKVHKKIEKKRNSDSKRAESKRSAKKKQKKQ